MGQRWARVGVVVGAVVLVAAGLLATIGVPAGPIGCGSLASPASHTALMSAAFNKDSDAAPKTQMSNGVELPEVGYPTPYQDAARTAVEDCRSKIDTRRKLVYAFAVIGLLLAGGSLYEIRRSN